MKRLGYSLVLLILLALVAVPVKALYFAHWDTAMGGFTAELYNEIVPLTAMNFVNLANSGFYNNLIFHRVVSGFVVQDGCPYGTGYGGPGYTIPDEFSPLLHHDQAGILAMARTSAPNSAGSQYYITLAPTPDLDGSYAIFGKIIEGLDVVMDIGEVPVDDNDRPLTPVNIYSVDILDLIIGETMPPLGEVENTPGAPLMFYIEAYGENLSYDWYLDDELLQSGQNFIFEHSFTQAGEFIVRCHVSSDEYQHDLIWQVNSATGLNEAALPEMEQERFYVQPNPFRDSVTLSYELKTPSQVELIIYNLKGQLVSKLENESKAPGSYHVIWNGQDSQEKKVPSGIYLVKLKAGRLSRTHKIMVLN